MIAHTTWLALDSAQSTIMWSLESIASRFSIGIWVQICLATYQSASYPLCVIADGCERAHPSNVQFRSKQAGHSGSP